ncbi:MAG TPA: phosphate propanoyltransferase [Steroidobacteraceae bacterium]|nr:phosphate propanoyltransferase [Steroidobacteraceae bacterium]
MNLDSKPPELPASIPIAISARHAHLSQATVDALFGPGHLLRVKQALAQPGQFAAEETITLAGPRGRLAQVRVMGPPRAADQIEISRSDEIALGIDAPLRLSGSLADTPGIELIGPAGRVTMTSGVVNPLRHIHMSPEDARRFGVVDRERVSVAIDSDGRDLIFGDVVVRVSPQFRLELHLDTDEGNAAGVAPSTTARLVRESGRGSE